MNILNNILQMWQRGGRCHLLYDATLHWSGLYGYLDTAYVTFTYSNSYLLHCMGTFFLMGQCQEVSALVILSHNRQTFITRCAHVSLLGELVCSFV